MSFSIPWMLSVYQYAQKKTPAIAGVFFESISIRFVS